MRFNFLGSAKAESPKEAWEGFQELGLQMQLNICKCLGQGGPISQGEEL